MVCAIPRHDHGARKEKRIPFHQARGEHRHFSRRKTHEGTGERGEKDDDISDCSRGTDWVFFSHFTCWFLFLVFIDPSCLSRFLPTVEYLSLGCTAHLTQNRRYLAWTGQERERGAKGANYTCMGWHGVSVGWIGEEWTERLKQAVTRDSPGFVVFFFYVMHRGRIAHSYVTYKLLSGDRSRESQP